MFLNLALLLFPGPSFVIDSACSSSLLALDQALQAIRADRCDAAIVAGCNLCLKPAYSLEFLRLGMLSPDGTCKSFDASGVHRKTGFSLPVVCKARFEGPVLSCVSNLFVSGVLKIQG